ncbi:MAG: extracellular solute-binding protein [Firmicutes bacterium]|uniref:Extracellular solute-binding protein n=1 Tax=Candidatus Scybalomonas excrementavium TaxID=2840943 RepID=A0A9D9I370_9FIRM|nr:extracellular solute-binding protein [Candidatus Scybalomonas excrementavium]
MRKYIKRFYLLFIFILLYAPILTLVVLSFNNSKTRSKWGGFTTKWYHQLFQNEQILNALSTTLIIAILSAVIATIIGTMAAIGIQNMKNKGRSFMLGVNNIPMMNSEIVTGISLMLLFIAVGNFYSKVTGTPSSFFGFITILLAHITFNIPYVVLSVMPKLRQVNPNTYEAALDLGASPIYAYFKVIIPDIAPGILSGFLLAFTMSLDDFVITHFTKGAGVDTLSTKIYTEVKKGIKPEMYALSTLMFGAVLLLLLIVNYAPKKKETEDGLSFSKEGSLKKILAVCMVIILCIGSFFAYRANTSSMHSEQVVVYNWGEYIDPDVLTQFTKETGIEVIYDEFDTNETMYPKVEAGAVAYDLVCPSDYMIKRMLDNDLLAKINFDNVPNIKYIGQTYLDQSKQFDPTNEYSVPYTWGTVGILYNKTMVDEPVDSWSILWDSKYKEQILMQDSVRDAFGVALKSLGFSLNSTNIDELKQARDLLIKQKPLIQAYVIDQVRDKMIGNEAAIGVIYSGEAIYTQRENPNLEYVIPKEGSNIWFDSWVIPKNAQNKENAEKFLNFLCRPDIALKNFEYITYSTPNEGARELIEDEDIKNSTIAFPDLSELKNCETFQFLGDDMDATYNALWKEVKAK